VVRDAEGSAFVGGPTNRNNSWSPVSSMGANPSSSTYADIHIDRSMPTPKRCRGLPRAFAAGEADIRDLNRAWDRAFLDICESGQLEKVDAMTPQQVALDAGNSAHEVRTWVAAFGALRAVGRYQVTSRFYRPIPELIAGFGVMTARGAGPRAD